MADTSSRYQIKGIQRGRTFHLASFGHAAMTIETAQAVVEQDDFERVLVVDSETWTQSIAADAIGILWDSTADTAAP